MKRHGGPRPLPKLPKPKTAEEIKADIERSNTSLEEYLNSPQFAEECPKAETKEKRREERRLAREAERDAAREDRRRKPKSPIDAYYNHVETCPFGSGTKERRAWKKDNPTARDQRLSGRRCSLPRGLIGIHKFLAIVVPWAGDVSAKPKQADFEAWTDHICRVTLGGQTHAAAAIATEFIILATRAASPPPSPIGASERRWLRRDGFSQS